jgi:hypothetical protein
VRYRPRWTLLGFGAIIVLVLFTYPTWRNFLVGRSVAGTFDDASQAQRAALAAIGRENRDAPPTIYFAMQTVVPAPTTEQPTPVLPDAQAILTGQFTEMDAIRVGKGRATIYRSADGSLLLRFDEFSVTNGPQLKVYLTGATEPKQREDLGVGAPEFLVGDLKGTLGNQQFPIPKELAIERYRSVVIFSEALNLIYSFALLQ